MKTSSSHALAALAMSCLLLVGAPQRAHAVAFSANLDINTPDEFSGGFSVRVGYEPPVGIDGGGSVTFTGQIPGSTFYLNAQSPYSGAGADLYDTALDADYGWLGFFGTWYGEEQYGYRHYVLNGFEYRLEADYSYGGMNPGYDPDPDLHLWPDDFVWGYWSGTFSIKKLSAAPPDPVGVPDSGGTLAILGGAFGLLAGVRRVLANRRTA